jgi:hypothetical protein
MLLVLAPTLWMVLVSDHVAGSYYNLVDGFGF